MACSCKNKSNVTPKKEVKTIAKKTNVTNNGKVTSNGKQMMRRKFM